MPNLIQIGERLPQVDLGCTATGTLRVLNTADLFGHSRSIILGLPGAFTPVCTGTHLRRYVELAPSFFKSGFEFIACLTPENPWAVSEWAQRIDPGGKIRFYSDGNLQFGRATGLTTTLPEYFLGTCLQRFIMVVNKGIVERLNIERVPTDVSCSAAEHLAKQEGVPLQV